MNAPLKIDINNIYFLRLCRNIPAAWQRFHRHFSCLQTFSGMVGDHSIRVWPQVAANYHVPGEMNFSRFMAAMLTSPG
jgi:hypothetical protein